jgi:hypothetical protein
MRNFNKVSQRVCYGIFLCAVVWLLAYQRLLLVEARNMHMYQTYMATAATRCILGGNDQNALKFLETSQNISINYIYYRRIMYSEAEHIVNLYYKTYAGQLNHERKEKLIQYSEEVYNTCSWEAFPNYYNVFDQYILPMMFPIFSPAAPDGIVKRFH